MKRVRFRYGVIAVLALLMTAPEPAATDEQRGVGQSYRIPYRVTNTNHYLVRVRLNGKGPFNFLVDTGAPALYLATETAKTIGLAPSETDFWTDLNRLDFEGGAFLTGLKCRVEDPFQLVGMNALGLPGASIDGILGFSVLARYRMDMDPTKDRMTWTRLDFDPKDPKVPRDVKKNAPLDVQAMSMLGPAAKLMAAFVGKHPETVYRHRGYLGVTLPNPGPNPKAGAENAEDLLVIQRVWPESPAAVAGLQPGDRLRSVAGRSVTSPKDAMDALEKIRPGEKIKLAVERNGKTITVTATAGEGF